MLLNSKGDVVTVPRKTRQNAAQIEAMLYPLRELHEPNQKHCGKLFSISERAREKVTQK